MDVIFEGWRTIYSTESDVLQSKVFEIFRHIFVAYIFLGQNINLFLGGSSEISNWSDYSGIWRVVTWIAVDSIAAEYDSLQVLCVIAFSLLVTTSGLIVILHLAQKFELRVHELFLLIIRLLLLNVCNFFFIPFFEWKN